jgi:hypothetical protein
MSNATALPPGLTAVRSRPPCRSPYLGRLRQEGNTRVLYGVLAGRGFIGLHQRRTGKRPNRVPSRFLCRFWVPFGSPKGLPVKHQTASGCSGDHY